MARVLALVAIGAALIPATHVSAKTISAASTPAVTWAGTLDGNGVVDGTASKGQVCTGTWQGPIVLSVSGSTLAGKGSVDIGAPACSIKLPTPVVQHVEFTITGTRDSNASGNTRFTLFLHGQSVTPSGYDPSGFLIHFGQTNEGIPLVLPTSGAKVDQRLTTTVPLSNSTVTLDDHFVLKISCDPTLLLKSDAEFKRADILFGEADTKFFKSEGEYDEWLADEEKEFVGISAEKGTLIQVAEGTAKKAGVEKVVGKIVDVFEYDFGPALTGYWIVSDVFPEALQHDVDLKEVRQLSDQGARTAKQAVADLTAELEQEPGCAELAKAQRAKEDLAAKKRALVDSWESTPSNLYWNPTRGEWQTEAAALKDAERILTSGSRSPQAHSASSRPPTTKKVRITQDQARAALPYLVKALRYHSRAMGRERTAEARTKAFTKAMKKLLARRQA